MIRFIKNLIYLDSIALSFIDPFTQRLIEVKKDSKQFERIKMIPHKMDSK